MPYDSCAGGSFCANRRCLCPDGSQDNRQGFCVSSRVQPLPQLPLPLNEKSSYEYEPMPGDRCGHTNTVCTGGAYCRLGYCVCPVNYVSLNGICVLDKSDRYGVQLNPGDKCIHSDWCTRGAICSMGKCTCPVGTHEDRDHCVPDSKLASPGNVCNTNQVCVGMSYCIRGVCTCARGYILGIQKCEKVVKRAQPKPMIYVNNKSTKYLHKYSIDLNENAGVPGRACDQHGNCDGGSYCDDSVCKCMKGMYPYQGVCYPITYGTNEAGPNMSCMGGSMCMGGSICDVDNICRCPIGRIVSNNVCIIPGEDIGVSPEEAVYLPGCPLPENPELCQLPDCFCSKDGLSGPANIPHEELPQLVVLTFDDAVNDKVINTYKRIFNGRFKNKNGCPIKGTFFVSHEWTNYNEVQYLAYAGHELASNSISHTGIKDEPEEIWADEMDGQRRILSTFGGVPLNDIKGIRAPQLSMGGDKMFRMMREKGFTYDNSMTANPGQTSPPYWPQTLDFASPWKCQNGDCPFNSHPGIWEIPLNQFYGYYLEEIQSYKRGSMLTSALSLNETRASVYDVMVRNFERGYNTNKAPFIVTIDAGFLNALPNYKSVDVLEQFISLSLQKPDVWIVTLDQLVQYMKDPVPLHQLSSYAPFECAQISQVEMPCETGNKCRYKTPYLNSGEHMLKTCGACPRKYPWVGNPEGI